MRHRDLIDPQTDSIDAPFPRTTSSPQRESSPIDVPNSAERAIEREVLGVVEQAAIAAGRLMGRGDRTEADQAATTAMRTTLGEMPINGKIVIGEGERDEAPMLYIGEQLGRGDEGMLALDIAVDPLEGTNLVANGLPGAVATLALAPRGGLFHAPDTYMDKLVVGPTSRDKVDIDAPVEDNLNAIATSLDRDVEDLTVVILDRGRHADLIARVRAAGARIKLITDGDLMPAISAAVAGTAIHAVMGVGGAPEAVLSAAALKCLGGGIQARLQWRNDAERRRAEKMGVDPSSDRVYRTDDLAPADEIVFAACGITTGDILTGVRYFGGGARTHSIVMTLKTGLIRFVDSTHLDHERDGTVRLA